MDRERQAKWDAANLVTLGTKLRRDEAQRFRELCEDCGGTVYAMLQVFIRFCLRNS